MPKRPDYAELVAQAEKSVTGIKDAELKRIAFQKILDELLGAAVPAAARQAARSRKYVGSEQKAKGAPKGGPQAYVEDLAEEGFFRKPKTIALVKAELENLGHHIPMTSLSGPLQKLCQRKVLRRQRVKTSGKKQTFAYSNW